MRSKVQGAALGLWDREGHVIVRGEARGLNGRSLAKVRSAQGRRAPAPAMGSSSDGLHTLPEYPQNAVSSAGDMRFYLQNLLDSKEKQLQQAGTLGQRVLAQQMELEERIRQLQELEADKSDDDEVEPDVRNRYRELADTIIAWDAENAQLSSAFGASLKVRGRHIVALKLITLSALAVCCCKIFTHFLLHGPAS